MFDSRNIRITGEDSPEARIAAVCVETCRRVKLLTGRSPDYADFRDDIRKFIQLELLLARLEGIRVGPHDRAQMLADTLLSLSELDFKSL